MPGRVHGWVAVQLLAVLLVFSGCSLLFNPSNGDDGNTDVCSGCSTQVGECVDPPTAQNCGGAGGTCSPCDVLRTDTCVNGDCLCGDGPACGDDLQCINGACTCTTQSCPGGCCSDIGTCREGNVFLSCGEGGQECSVCDPIAADQCGDVTRACQCGETLEACAPGLHCVGDECICDSVSCDGCCTPDGQCLIGTENSACGNSGGVCSDCDADTCLAGGVCSGCAVDCVGRGCCSGNDCVDVGPGAPACNGVAAQACESCGIGADGCDIQGVCSCGQEAACSDGQECIGGVCQCTATSCPNGCCDNQEVCQNTMDNVTCGIAGATCTGCKDGQRCDVGACVCDEVSCPEGCCTDEGLCIPAGSPGNDCAVNGGVCLNCTSDQICNEALQSCVNNQGMDGGVTIPDDGGVGGI